jgi:hypothetical protein
MSKTSFEITKGGQSCECLVLTVIFFAAMGVRAEDFTGLHNPIWTSADNLRDPAVLKADDGCHLFYSRLSAGQGGWSNPTNRHIAEVVTKDFVPFTNDRDVSPGGCASPDLEKSSCPASRRNFRHMPSKVRCLSHREIWSAG